jgi:hypothetical protein
MMVNRLAVLMAFLIATSPVDSSFLRVAPLCDYKLHPDHRIHHHPGTCIVLQIQNLAIKGVLNRLFRQALVMLEQTDREESRI